MATKPNLEGTMIGIVIFIVGVYLAYLIGLEGIDTRGTFSFLLIPRMSILPLVGLHVVCYGAGFKRMELTTLLLIAVAAVLDVASVSFL